MGGGVESRRHARLSRTTWRPGEVFRPRMVPANGPQPDWRPARPSNL